MDGGRYGGGGREGMREGGREGGREEGRKGGREGTRAKPGNQLVSNTYINSFDIIFLSLLPYPTGGGGGGGSFRGHNLKVTKHSFKKYLRMQLS